ncbi:MAG: hypothetical protein ABIJ26_05420 [Candidatus Margulisiibacteriota bacterium]
MKVQSHFLLPCHKIGSGKTAVKNKMNPFVAAYDATRQSLELVSVPGELSGVALRTETLSRLMAGVIYDGNIVIVKDLSSFAPTTMQERMRASGGKRILDNVNVNVEIRTPEGGIETKEMFQSLVLSSLPDLPRGQMAGSALIVPIGPKKAGMPADGCIIQLLGSFPSQENIDEAVRCAASFAGRTGLLDP